MVTYTSVPLKCHLRGINKFTMMKRETWIDILDSVECTPSKYTEELAARDERNIG